MVRPALLILLIAVAPALLQPDGMVSAQTKEQREQQLRLLDEEIKRMRSDIESLQSEEDNTIRSIERLRIEYRMHLREADRLGLQIESSEERVDELNKEVEVITVSLRERQAELGGILRRLYISGRQGLLRAFLSVPKPKEIGLAQSYLAAVAGRENKFIEDFKRDISRLQARKDEIAEQRENLVKMREQEQQHSADALESQRKQENMLDQIRSKRGIYGQALQEKMAAREQLKQLIERLTAAESEYRATNISASQGQLAWPCPGEVIARFGRVRDPVYDVVLENDGIDIKAPLGTPVIAVFSGQVVFSDWTDGRGNIVVLDHGNNYYSLYAHLDVISVKEGDAISTGQQVGTVGESGSLKGAILHFEIRQRAKALDPIAWLRKRGG